jgi:hypothetical protein
MNRKLCQHRGTLPRSIEPSRVDFHVARTSKREKALSAARSAPSAVDRSYHLGESPHEAEAKK